MTREEEVQYEQDELGNERRKLDTLRAQEGMAGTTSDDSGIASIASGDVGSDVLILSKPTHADEMILDLIHAYNSQSSDTFRIKEATLDGSNSITSTTRRTVPIVVGSEETREIEYEGDTFDKAIAVESQFQGEIGVAVISDHKESSESNIST